MNSQKQENLLNLALTVTAEERRNSLELDVGVLEGTRWELIIKYHGDFPEKIQSLEEQYNTDFQVEYLLPGYAILTVEEAYLDRVTALTEVDYVEKPKALYEDAITISQANVTSCVAEVTQGIPNLTGNGVLIGIPDSGIDYSDSIFLNTSLKTRIAYLWDQTSLLDGKNPEGFYEGAEFSGEELDRSLDKNAELSFDRSGHGTAVADICAGSGAAYESELLIVKLGSGNPQGFTRTTELMRAISWMIQKAVLLERPLVINISYGSTYGSHDGTSLLETFLDAAADVYKTVICVGSGNEGAAAGHVETVVDIPREIEWSVAPFQPSLNVSIWKNYVDNFGLTIVSPKGERITGFQNTSGYETYEIEQTKVLVYIGEPSPYSQVQEYYLEFQETETQNGIAAGIWKIFIEPIRVVDGYCHLYLPAATVLTEGTNFFRPSPETTLTIPATAQKVITVGAYDSVYEEYADFSGRGYEQTDDRRLASWQSNVQKPDLVAPGVSILARDGRGGTTIVSGTSFATPFVTAAAALLMEWGIVRGNDPFLYGEKMKAYLRKGARPIRGESLYPNEKIGYGALCLAASMPDIT